LQTLCLLQLVANLFQPLNLLKLSVIALLMLISKGGNAELMPWPENPHQWSYGGRPLILAGASDDDNLFQWPTERLIPHLDLLKRSGGNLVRNTMSDRRDKGFEVYPYLEVEPGRYDLNRWNPEYWERFERFLKETHHRQIMVQIELWDRFDFADHGEIKHWQNHPYNPRNNINYNRWQSRLDIRYPQHPGKNKQPFFFTTPAQHRNQLLLDFQQRYIDRVMSYSLQYDHILYCIDNETKAGEAWSRYWAQYVKRKARAVNKRIYVTEMLDERTMDPAVHGRTIDHPELYDFIEVSQNNHNDGHLHWQNLMRVRGYLNAIPRPMNSIKIYGATSSKYGDQQQAIARFWRNVLAGTSAIRFHRPESGLGLNETASHAIRALRALESKVSLAGIMPINVSVAAGDAYMASAGETRLVYLPAGEALIKLDAPKTMHVEWLNLATAAWHQSRIPTLRQNVHLKAPDTGHWMVVLRLKPS
jgi:hypothetical protein